MSITKEEPRWNSLKNLRRQIFLSNLKIGVSKSEKFDDRKVIFYVHLSHIAVKKEEKVYVGKYLGKQGWNKKWSEGYHIHLEVRTVLRGNKPPTKPSRGAAAVFNNRNIEPIRYLHGELLEDLGNRPVRAAPSILRTLTQTWGDLKSKD